MLPALALLCWGEGVGGGGEGKGVFPEFLL